MLEKLFETWSQLGSIIASLVIVWAYAPRAIRHLYPYISIQFPEFTDDQLKQCEPFTVIQNYLRRIASTRAKRLKAESIQDDQSLVLNMNENEGVVDEFKGVKVWWSSSQVAPLMPSTSVNPPSDKRGYTLTFHQSHRDLIINSYIKHVLDERKMVAAKNWKRKLFTNNPSSNGNHKGIMWSHVAFENPATFDTLAMEPSKKEEIMNDLMKFQRRKEYYQKIGKAWKRGYLLYGPPGTGKSTLIAAMANFLDYDVYDLDLTIVNDNTELRKLLIHTSEKSIIVIENIDCSLDLTGQRKTKRQKKDDEEKADPVEKMVRGEEESKVTLSGLLNGIDGLWSACRGERIIVFTTNFVEKLDPALVRRGRMDKHIQMSYCCFESFKVLARNYLDLESHPLFTRVRQLLEETKMTPADVAENLLSMADNEDVEACLKGLIEALENVKEDARKKPEEEEKAAIAAAAEATAARAMVEEGGQLTFNEGPQEVDKTNKKKGGGQEGGRTKEVKENGVLSPIF